MAVTVKPFTSCDLCSAIGLTTPATDKRVLPDPDSRKPSESDVCGLCSAVVDFNLPRLNYVLPRLSALDTFWRLVRPIEERSSPPKRVLKALEDAVEAPADELGQLALDEAPDKPAATASTESVRVECMECIPPQPMGYNSRHAHARKKHDVTASAIIWRDPNKALIYPCTVHRDCDETGFAFATVIGRRAHEAQSQNGPIKTNSEAAPEETPQEPRKPRAEYGAWGDWAPGIQQVGCPLSHPSKPDHKGPYWLLYKNRSSHAQVVHALPLWGIEWAVRAEPGDTFTLPYPCTEHDHCTHTGLAFSTELGLKTHVRSLAPKAA
jgi:hypothetical protein